MISKVIKTKGRGGVVIWRKKTCQLIFLDIFFSQDGDRRHSLKLYRWTTPWRTWGSSTRRGSGWRCSRLFWMPEIKMKNSNVLVTKEILARVFWLIFWVCFVWVFHIWLVTGNQNGKLTGTDPNVHWFKLTLCFWRRIIQKVKIIM